MAGTLFCWLIKGSDKKVIYFSDIRDLYNQATVPVVVPETGSVGQLTLW